MLSIVQSRMTSRANLRSFCTLLNVPQRYANTLLEKYFDVGISFWYSKNLQSNILTKYSLFSYTTFVSSLIVITANFKWHYAYTTNRLPWTFRWKTNCERANFLNKFWQHKIINNFANDLLCLEPHLFIFIIIWIYFCYLVIYSAFSR